MNTCNHFNHIDCDTRDTVTGYIRRIEYDLLRKHNGNAFYHIPKAITIHCISLVHDLSLHHGYHQWSISGAELQHQILNCKEVGHCLESAPFLIAKLRWKLNLFPNGDKPKRRGLFMVNLILLDLPSKWDHILILRTMALDEMNIKRTTIRSYKKETSSGWRSKTLCLSEIRALSPNRLTLSVTIKVLRIELLAPSLSHRGNTIFYESYPLHYERVSNLRWTIPRSLLMEGVDSDGHKCYQNDVDCDGMWCIQFCPRSEENCVYLQLLCLPPNIDKIEVQYTIGFEELGLRSTLISLFEYDSSAFGWKIPKHRFQIDIGREGIDGHSINGNESGTVTISCDVVIVNEYDAEGNMINEVESEWIRYKQRTQSMGLRLQRERRSEYQFESLTLELEAMRQSMDEMKDTVQKLLHQNRVKSIHSEKLQHFRNLKDWLGNTVGLSQYYDILEKNGFDDLQSMGLLTMQDLNDIGITKRGHQKKLLFHAAHLT